jgi:hypothetical protein
MREPFYRSDSRTQRVEDVQVDRLIDGVARVKVLRVLDLGTDLELEAQVEMLGGFVFVGRRARRD